MVEPLPKRFSVSEYERMASSLWLEDTRVELLDGEVYEMTPIGPSHAYRVLSLNEQLVRVLGAQAVVLCQSSIHLGDYSEPEPDLALLKPPKTRYRERLAEAGDVLLLVEVADTTLAFDRDKKLPLYARAGIPEVWIVNVAERQLESYRQPKNGRYGELKTYAEGEAVKPLGFEEAIAWWE
jgi:Uma2 family endonuclease